MIFLRIAVLFYSDVGGAIYIADLDILSRVKVEYVTLPGWNTSIEKAKSIEELPENCRKYLQFIEDHLGGVKIEWIGVGPARESMIKL